jgi:hypothetical protein
MRSVSESVGKVLTRARELGPLLVLTERRFVKRASREMLELFWSERREHPELTGPPLYEAVVARRLGPESTNAREIVQRAEESFADWPVERSLTFRDVVHYVVFEEYLRTFSARDGARTRMGAMVARIIPKEI